MRQCISWMLHGYLEDEHGEFFIQNRLDAASSSSHVELISTELLNRSMMAAGLVPDSRLSTTTAFDWNNTIAVKLKLLPESVVFPRIVPKIVFSGKAIIMQSQYREHRDVIGCMEYFSKGIPKTSLVAEGLNSDEPNIVGLSTAQVDHFHRELENIVKNVNTEQSNYCFEKLTSDIHDLISSQLWSLLRDRLNFVSFLHIMRNIYFLGSGEFYQTLHDSIDCLSATAKTRGTDSNTNALLRDAFINSCKLLNLDDASLGSSVRLEVQSDDVVISDFSMQQDEVVLVGAANVNDSYIGHVLDLSHDIVSKSRIASRVVMNASSSASVVSGIPSMWSRLISDACSDNNIHRPSVKQTLVSSGTVWMKHSKQISRGFSFSASFSTNFNSLPALLSAVDTSSR